MAGMNNRSCNVDDLHGMTVVMETAGEKTYIGRFDQALGDFYVIHDADIFEPGADGVTKAAYLAKTAAFGVWAKQKDFYVPVAEVVSVKKLNEFKAPV